MFGMHQPDSSSFSPEFSASLFLASPLFPNRCALFCRAFHTQPVPFQLLPHTCFTLSNTISVELFCNQPFPHTLQNTRDRVPSSRYFFRLPVHQSPLFPVVHPISLQPLTKCSSRNSFALTTIHFHGGCIPPSLTDAVGAPLRSNGNPCIPFLFVPLQALSFTTSGVHPPPLPRAFSAKGTILPAKAVQ